jgi:hypothetical protein
MKFNEFVQFNDIDLDIIKVDKFFHNLENDIPLLLDEKLISYFGYSDDMPEETQSQIRKKNYASKRRVSDLFETNFLEYQNHLWWNYSSDEYKNFLCCDRSQHKNIKNLSPEMIEKLYPLVKKKGQQPNYILIMPKLFKEGLMLCQTTKGKQIRRFYIDMLDVFNLYVKYQNKMSIVTLECKLDKMLLKLDSSEKKLDESEKKLDESEKKREYGRIIYEEERKKTDVRFNKLIGISEDIKGQNDTLEVKLDDANRELKDTNVVLKDVAKQHVEINKLDLKKHPKFIILKDPNDDQMPYYAIRRQKESLQEAIDEIKEKYPDLKNWIQIPQPNAIAFFNLIKKELGEYMDRDGNWFGLKNITSSEFKKRVKELNKKRLAPPKKKVFT